MTGWVVILQRQPQVAYASWWGLFVPDIQSSGVDVVTEQRHFTLVT